MLVISEIIGNQDQPEIASALHRLGHDGALDSLVLSRADLSRRRVRARTEAGNDVAIALRRDQSLFDGAVLRLDQDVALVVRVEAEHWLRVKPADECVALRLGYFAGNLHWRVKFDERDLLVAVETDVASLVSRLQPMIDAGEVECLVPGSLQ